LQAVPEKQLAAAKAQAKFWEIPESDLILSCTADGKTERRLRDDVFWDVKVPLAKAYTTIRWSKLFNDRNTYPLLPYDPVTFTEANRVRCEVITRLIQQMAQNYGYSSILRQVILQALMYPVPAFMF